MTKDGDSQLDSPEEINDKLFEWHEFIYAF